MMAVMSAYRWSVVSRAIAAIVGGYVIVSLLTIALSMLLVIAGMDKPEAVLAASMASFLFYAGIVMAVFYARTALRAWIGLTIAAVPLAAFYMLYAGSFE